MSGARKLQTEIDRTLKKVEEGVEIFDEIWDKASPGLSACNKNNLRQEILSAKLTSTRMYSGLRGHTAESKGEV